MSPFTRDIDPPPALEDRVVDALRERGLLETGPRRGVRVAGAIAAMVAIFIAGFVVGRWQGAAASPRDAVHPSRFVLLLHEPDGASLPQADQQARVDEYRTWARQVVRDGYPISGEKLRDAPGETLSGFFIVSVPDEATARAIAASCPHNRYGGRVELREIEPT
jgi:hypothetical protein